MSQLERRVRALEDRAALAQLNHRYARLVDLGRFEEFAALFAHGTWRDCTGADEVLAWLRENVRLYDGTPRTNHLISALDIEVDGDAARGRSTITVYQQRPGTADISVITVNDYIDEYQRIEGEWWFSSRHVVRRLEGDMSAHVFDQSR